MHFPLVCAVSHKRKTARICQYVLDFIILTLYNSLNDYWAKWEWLRRLCFWDSCRFLNFFFLFFFCWLIYILLMQRYEVLGHVYKVWASFKERKLWGIKKNKTSNVITSLFIPFTHWIIHFLRAGNWISIIYKHMTSHMILTKCLFNELAHTIIFLQKYV